MIGFGNAKWALSFQVIPFDLLPAWYAAICVSLR